MIIVTVPPADEPVSPAELKAHLRVTHDLEDDLLAALLAAARERLETELGVRLLATGLQEETDAPTGFATLSVGPVLDVDAVAIRATDGAWAPLSADGWSAGGERPGVVTLGRAAYVRIDYRAGFATDASRLPASLKLAVLALAADAYERRADPTSPAPAGLGPAERWAAAYRRVRL